MTEPDALLPGADPIATLGTLVAHATVSSNQPGKSISNVAMMDHIQRTLEAYGGHVTRSSIDPDSEFYLNHPDAADALAKFGRQDTMVVRFGPPDAEGGVLLSGHTDVQPVKPELWKTDDPFQLTSGTEAGDEGKLLGRGTADMLGFLANMLRVGAMLKDRQETLEKPVYLAFSWGEEVGCAGSRFMEAHLAEHDIKPNIYLIGEGTENELIIGHKGGMFMEVNVQGISRHSSEPETGLDANRFAHELQSFIYELQDKLMGETYHDPNFDPPYPVLNIGRIEGGNGGNTVPGWTRIEMHARPTPGLDVEEEILKPIQEKVTALEAEMKALAVDRKLNPDECGMSFAQLSETLPLPPPTSEAMLDQVKNVYADVNDMNVAAVTPKFVSFATEAGFFERHAQNHAPETDHVTMVWHTNPLAKNNAHKPNEFIHKHDLLNGIRFPVALINEICVQKELGQTTEIPGETIVVTVQPERLIPVPERVIAKGGV